MTRPALRALALLLGVSLVGCTPSVDPTATPAPSSSSPTTPAPNELTVAPGEKPPAVFEGDCAAALADERLSDVLDLDFTLESSASAGSVGNLGGLQCVWRSDAGSLVVELLPTFALSETEFPPDQEAFYFQDCNPAFVCAWSSRSGALWVSGSFQLSTGMTRASVDAWGAQIAAEILENFAAGPQVAWLRDQSGWWPDLDCAAVAGQVGAELGVELTGVAAGYPDPPLPGVLLAAIASNSTSCYLNASDPAQRPIELHTTAGEAWTLPLNPADSPVESGVPGISASLDSGYSSTDSAGYTLTDGVNRMIAYVPTTGAQSGEEILMALAAAAATLG